MLPVVLGSLLDLTVKVRAAEAETPTDLRMADFAHLCAQLDAATGLGALPAYRASLDDLNDDVIEGDLLAQTVLRHADTIEPGAAQRMTSTEWLHCLSRLYSGDELPSPAQGVADHRQSPLRPAQAPPTHPGRPGRPHRLGPHQGGPLPRNDPHAPPRPRTSRRGRSDPRPARSPNKQEEHHRPRRAPLAVRRNAAPRSRRAAAPSSLCEAHRNYYRHPLSLS